MSDVIERMSKAFFAKAGRAPYASWPGGLDDPIDHTSMTAAARVLLDEALGPVTDEERKKFDRTYYGESDSGLLAALSAVVDMLASRRARLLPESKDAAVEQAQGMFDGSGKLLPIFTVADVVAKVRKTDMEGR